MSAEALYEAMGLEDYEVEGTWENDGTLYVQVVVPRGALAQWHSLESPDASARGSESGISPRIPR